VSWSPQGTYIATLHRQGVRLWGGNSWDHQARFAHPFVKLLDFSPCEQYVVTWSHEPIVVPENAPQGPEFFSPEDEGNNIAVWDIKTGHLLRTFPTTAAEKEDLQTKKQMQWPALKWSPDDKFVARITPGQQISVYELPGMGLQGKKSLKIEGVVDFEWRPLGDKDREDADKEAKTEAAGKGTKKTRENMLVYWTPEVSNQPARVTLLSFPGRAVLRQKNLFNVTEVSGPSNTTRFPIHEQLFGSVNYTGKTKATSSASRLTVTPRPRSPSSATWKFSVLGRKISLLKLSS
jgi:translation initiation factor 3 subunit B